MLDKEPVEQMDKQDISDLHHACRLLSESPIVKGAEKERYRILANQFWWEITRRVEVEMAMEGLRGNSN